MNFSHICHFRPMTQPNPLETQIFDPFPTQPNPTRGSTQPMDNSEEGKQYVFTRCTANVSSLLVPRTFTMLLKVPQNMPRKQEGSISPLLQVRLQVF